MNLRYFGFCDGEISFVRHPRPAFFLLCFAFALESYWKGHWEWRMDREWSREGNQRYQFGLRSLGLGQQRWNTAKKRNLEKKREDENRTHDMKSFVLLHFRSVDPRYVILAGIGME
jgi:hypothetical protein